MELLLGLFVWYVWSNPPGLKLRTDVEKKTPKPDYTCTNFYDR